MSRQNSTIIENVKIVMLKGEKGDAGATYDDTDIRNLIRSQNAVISDLVELVNSYDGTLIMQDFATLEESAEASHAYLVGDYLMYESQFYRVISNIAIGDTLTEGTNIVATTIDEELNNLQNEILEYVAMEQFKMFYNLADKSTVIEKDNNGDLISIVETTNYAVATSTFATSGTTTTITTTIVPTIGEYNYVKTSVIDEVGNETTITESYIVTSKEEETNE